MEQVGVGDALEAGLAGAPFRHPLGHALDDVVRVGAYLDRLRGRRRLEGSLDGLSTPYAINPRNRGRSHALERALTHRELGTLVGLLVARERLRYITAHRWIESARAHGMFQRSLTRSHSQALLVVVDWMVGTSVPCIACSEPHADASRGARRAIAETRAIGVDHLRVARASSLRRWRRAQAAGATLV